MVCNVAEGEQTVEHRTQPDASTAVDRINTLKTGDADLRFYTYITTVQDG